MGLFSRFGNILRGFFGLYVDNLEKTNPDALLADIKNQLDKAKKEAEEQIIDIQTNAEMMKIEFNTSEKNLKAIKARIDTTKRQGDEELLVQLLMQEEEQQLVYEMHQATYSNALEEVAKIKEDFKIFESEMNQKLNEIKSLKSQANLAALRENINSMNSRYSNAGNRLSQVSNQMDRARDIVNRKTARANAIGSLNIEDTDVKMKKLDLDSTRERAKARAAAMLSGSEGFEVKEKIDNRVDA